MAPLFPGLTAARGPHLRDYQVATAAGLLIGLRRYPAATFTVMFPRQAGKNEVSAVVVAALHPQAEISEQRVRRVLAFSERIAGSAGVARAEANRVTVGRASAIFLSASPAAHVAGHTASIALIGDEAQDIDTDWFNRQFRPMAASTGAPTVLFGTAWDGETLLEAAAEANRARDAATRARREERWSPFHFQVDWEEVAAANPRYGEYVRHERERLGRNHPLFLSQYELVAAQGAGRLFGPDHLALLEGDHIRLRGPLPGERYVAGIDFGGDGAGGDATVLTIARVAEGRCEVVEHATWRGADFGRVTGEVSEICRAWRIARLVADATGLGSPLADELVKTLGEHLVERFVFTAGSKSDLGFAMVAAARMAGLRLYRDDGSADSTACWRELRECRARFHGHTRMSWEAPAGLHDDYVASLALCLRAVGGIGAPRVAQGRRPAD
jgi:hypothetical protein